LRFWDSSAVVPLLVEEPASGAVDALLEEDGEVAAWWAALVECASALSGKRREGVLSEEDERDALAVLKSLSERWVEVRPTEPVRLLAERSLRVHEALRAADALQLAAAIIWTGGTPAGRQLVCLDERLATAAAREGFSVFPRPSGP
jgi:predicted nucleic acid-binding protein